MKLKIKRLRDVPLPEYKTDGSSGLDLHAAIIDPIFIPVGQKAMIPTGIAVELPKGYEIQVRPRSGLAKIGVWPILGTVDNDYRGEIKVLLFNGACEAYINSETDEEGFWVEPNMRIAQMIVAPVAHVQVVEVEELTPTRRGANGFGSTGLK